MAALTNTIKAEDVVTALDVEFSANFDQELNQLMDILGIFGVDVVAAGTALYQYKVTGELNDATVDEGDEVPLSNYKVAKDPIGEIEIRPYRKMTTAQAILKSGFENAVRRTDQKMVKDMRAVILSKFFESLKKGEGEAEGNGLQGALAMAEAKLGDALESNADEATAIVHFVNRQDIAKYLAEANVTVQTVFGMDYLASFLGVNNIFMTNKVEQGTIYVTPAENIHIYGVDFGALGAAGVEYEVQEGSVIGVHHEPNYSRTSAETYALTGATFVPEIKDYIIKATINDAAALSAQPVAVSTKKD